MSGLRSASQVLAESRRCLIELTFQVAMRTGLAPYFSGSMILSDLPSPAEAGFAKAGNRNPLFGIMLQSAKLVPQPQEAVAFGLLTLKADPIRSSTKSISAPAM